MMTEREPLFDDFWNEIHEPIQMGELEWDAADVLYEMDPIAYKEYANKYFDVMTA